MSLISLGKMPVFLFMRAVRKVLLFHGNEGECACYKYRSLKVLWDFGCVKHRRMVCSHH